MAALTPAGVRNQRHNASQEIHQPKTWRTRAGLRHASAPRCGELLVDSVSSTEATVKACGVALAKPQGLSWAPHLSSGPRVNVGTTRWLPPRRQRARWYRQICTPVPAVVADTSSYRHASPSFGKMPLPPPSMVG